MDHERPIFLANSLIVCNYKHLRHITIIFLKNLALKKIHPIFILIEVFLH